MRPGLHRLKTVLRERWPWAAAAWLRWKERGQRWQGGPDHLRRVFGSIYAGNLWGDPESVSGGGSTAAATEALRFSLPALLQREGVSTLLDAACGDANWIRATQLPLQVYIGMDVVPGLIARNRETAGPEGQVFLLGDITRDPLPRADLVLCRDCWIHYSYHYIWACLENFRRSGSRLLLTTTYRGLPANREMLTGQWRPLDLHLPPFAFPPADDFLVEGACEVDGSQLTRGLALWRLSALPGGPSPLARFSSPARSSVTSGQT
jgi:hypothetical protein